MTLSRPEAACERVLKTLKTSRLTFSVNETPFSAYITIRKKLSHNVHDENPNIPLYLSDSESGNTCSGFEILTKENSALKTKLEEIEKENEVLKAEHETLLNSFNSVKRTTETFTLKLEKENGYLQKSLEKIKVENKRVENDLETMEKNWKTQNRTLKQNEKKIYDLEKENATVKENLQIESAELASLKIEVSKEKKQLERRNKKTENKLFLQNLKSESHADRHECGKCGEIFPSGQNLEDHILNIHTATSSTQTDGKEFVDKKIQVQNSDKISEHQFEEYYCFYCGEKINSEQNLKDHVLKCHGLHGTHLPLSKLQVCAKEPDIKEAFEAYLLDYQTEQARQFQCDICQNIFNSETLLGMHRVFTHSRLKLD